VEPGISPLLLDLMENRNLRTEGNMPNTNDDDDDN
jgi:hypothetical protein